MANTQNPQSRFAGTAKKSLGKILFGRTTLILLALVLQFVLLFVMMFDLLQGLPLIFGGTVVFTAVMLLVVLNTRDNPTVKLTWCVIIGLLPLFGSILYGFVRLDLGCRMKKKLLQRTYRESISFLPDQRQRLEEVKNNDQRLYQLACYLRCYSGSSLYANTEVTYFPLGEDKFRQMVLELEKAERFIFLEYFEIAPGYMWDTILEILTRKADQGVEVRLLYDGSCAVLDLPYHYPRKLEKLGIKCKMFSPFRPFVSTHYNNRDHRKILVIDGHTAFTGGINLLDRYINREQVYGHWKDTAVMVRGEAARGFTMLFLQMWNYDEQERLFAPYLRAPLPEVTAPGFVIPYGDSPLDAERVGQMVYLNMLNQAKDYVYIMTPYLILDNETLTALQFAAKRGVDVRLILPHIPDKKVVFAMARSHYRELMETGVKIYEYTPGFVHAKMFLCDDREAVVGTINLDYRSLYLHFECAAYLYRVPALGDIREDFDRTMEQSRLVTMEDVQRQSALSRLTAAVLKVMAPLM